MIFRYLRSHKKSDVWIGLIRWKQVLNVIILRKFWIYLSLNNKKIFKKKLIFKHVTFDNLTFFKICVFKMLACIRSFNKIIFWIKKISKKNCNLMTLEFNHYIVKNLFIYNVSIQMKYWKKNKFKISLILIIKITLCDLQTSFHKKSLHLYNHNKVLIR